MRRALIFFIIVISGEGLFAQTCTTLGQTPPTAFPVCALHPYAQTNVPICATTDLFVPGCDLGGALYEDKNPFWYKFTCYQAGTLGFTIVPNNQGDDYDWQLYDVTGLDPNEVLTNQHIIVTGNWSGSYGNTGAQHGGVSYIQCASAPADNQPRFSAMPTLIVGHHYILLISHFTDSQSGYTLTFGGGSAVITDPQDPHLQSANAPCNGTQIQVITNKKMQCGSIASNGSDFYVVTPAGVSIPAIAASSEQCANAFDLDTLSVFMSAPLAPGTYSLYIKTGSDGNTLLDDCGAEIPEGEHEEFTVYPLYPTPLDSLTKPGCAPQTLQLVFKKPIQCSSINAGDFSITGDYPVTITAAGGHCDRHGLTPDIIITLSAPMQVHGNFELILHSGPDGNTILDECGEETPAASIPFFVKDTVNADFQYTIDYSCTKDIISLSHNGANGVNKWIWGINGGIPAGSTLQHPVAIYGNFNPKQVQLIVSNGVCYDTSTTKIVLDNYFKAAFNVTDLICPQTPVTFTNVTQGNIVDWQWIFGNGNIVNVKDPAPQIYTPLEDDDYTAMPQLIVKNNYGCYDTASRPVKILYSCFIAVPSAFTPNGDGLNDYLYPLKAYKSTNMSFSVYNRFGQRVFYSNSWLNKWDGTFKGMPQATGTYVWMLDYVNSQSGKHVFQKGTTILIR